MGMSLRNMCKKIKRYDDLIHTKEKLEKSFNQLKENVIYGQQLVQIGSWKYDAVKDQIYGSEEIRVYSCPVWI